MANPIPVTKKCRCCKEEKILSEFEFSDNSKSKRATTCKTCVGEKTNNDSDICCLYHMMFANALNQLHSALDVIEALQFNGEEIRVELLKRMLTITHNGRVFCKYDTCMKDSPNRPAA